MENPILNFLSTNVYPFAASNSDEDVIIFYEEYFSVMNAGDKSYAYRCGWKLRVGNEKIDLCSVPSAKVHTASNSLKNGQWITSWEDDRNGGKDIYAQNIQLDGSLGPIIIQNDLTVTPDSVICDVSWGHHVHIINNTTEEVIVSIFTLN